MKNKDRLLAYCTDNKNVAARFDADLSKAGISFIHISNEQSSANMAKELLKRDGDIFLMISDNFLKSSQCMADALELLTKGLQQQRLQAIIVDAMIAKSPGETPEAQPTQFSRISDLINYMNFWQERYLKLRKTRDTVPKGKMDEFDKELKRVRVISAEIGEFLRMLRDTEYWTMSQLVNDHYAMFFNKIGKKDLIIPLQKEHMETTTNEDELKMVKKELHIATEIHSDESDAFELADTTDLSKLEKEQRETQQIFSSIFDEPKDKKTEDLTEIEELLEDDNDSANELTVPPAMTSQTLPLEEAGENENEITNRLEKRFFERIGLLIENGDELTAARELHQFIQANPKHAHAHYQLALIEIGNEHFAEAKHHAEQAVKLQPDSSNYHLALGRILFHFYAENPEASEQSFKNAIQLNPANTAAHYEYAMLLHEVLKKPKKAINHLELTLAINPEHPFANYDLALIYYGMKKRTKAARHYEKAFTINPELRTPDNDIAFWYETYLTTDEIELDDEEKVILDPEEALLYEMDKTGTDTDFAEIILETEVLPEGIEDDLLDEEVQQLIAQEEENLKEQVPAVTAFIPSGNSAVAVKTILITGATSGIGRATAIRFAREGHRLILTGRRAERLKELSAELHDLYNNDITTLEFDVRYLSAAKTSFNSLGPEWENIDLLINNAGLAKGLDYIHEGDVKHWEIMLDTNVKGLLFMTRIIAPGMVARKQGQIINVCSSAGHEVYPKGAVYCATKHAVDALTKGMRLDLYEHGIRVGQVSPGHVEETEFAVVRFDGDKGRANIYTDFQPLKASDVAEAIFYMANTPPHVTIQDIVLMGTQQASNIHINRNGR
jgi:NADP-dependent 3-hydroxy acid dehydrogenase YdfG/tetratricopeptide (TPR) repeat protein